MDLYRLRIEVPDTPGRVGRVLVALGQLNIDVVEIDCHNVDGSVRVDDLFIHVMRPLDIPAIAHAVEKAGCPLVELRPLAAHDLEDPVTRSMRLITQLVTADAITDDLIAWCGGELVRSDLACVVDAQTVTASSAAGRALATGIAVHEQEWVKRLSTNGVRAWTLVVPFEHRERSAVVVAHRMASRFTRTETARLRQLLDAVSRHVGRTPRHIDSEPSQFSGSTWDFW